MPLLRLVTSFWITLQDTLEAKCQWLVGEDISLFPYRSPSTLRGAQNNRISNGFISDDSSVRLERYSFPSRSLGDLLAKVSNI